jgi:hypothetical protein
MSRAVWHTLPAGTIKRIHVDRRVIDSNRKHGTDKPPVTIQTSKGSRKCRVVMIDGPSTVWYQPKKPLPCGARLWVSTTATVRWMA